MAKVLVVGGAGYVGSVLVPALADRGHEVTVIDKLWFGNHLPEYIPVIEADLFSLNDDDLRGYDTVIFLAGLSNDPMADWDPKMNFVANGAGPAYLSFFAQRAGVSRFIHGGSCSVYGNASADSTSDLLVETDPLHSDFPYGISKINGEAACMALMSQDSGEEFSVISFRKGTVCGHSPRMRFDLVINMMMRDAMMLGKVTINNADIWRPILTIEDASMAYIQAVEARPELSGVFNIASGNFTIGQLGKAVQDFVSDEMKKPVTLNVLSKRDKRNYKVSTDQAYAQLGFAAGKDPLEEIMRGIFVRWRLYGDVYSPKYYNIDTFKRLLGQQDISPAYVA